MRSHRSIMIDLTSRPVIRNDAAISNQERPRTPTKKEINLYPMIIVKQPTDESRISCQSPDSPIKNTRKLQHTQSMKNLTISQIMKEDSASLSPLKRSSEFLKLKKIEASNGKGVRHSSLPKSSRVSLDHPSLQNVREIFANSKIYSTDQSPVKVRLPVLKVNDQSQTLNSVIVPLNTFHSFIARGGNLTNLILS